MFLNLKIMCKSTNKYNVKTKTANRKFNNEFTEHSRSKQRA